MGLDLVRRHLLGEKFEPYLDEDLVVAVEEVMAELDRKPRGLTVDARRCDKLITLAGYIYSRVTGMFNRAEEDRKEIDAGLYGRGKDELSGKDKRGPSNDQITNWILTQAAHKAAKRKETVLRELRELADALKEACRARQFIVTELCRLIREQEIE